MFKTTIRNIAILAAVAFVSACGGQAQAQTIPLSYKATNGAPFSVDNAQKITGLAGSVNVVDDTGFSSTSSSGTLYTDSSSLVYTKITTDPVFLASWLQVGATTTWVNPAYFRGVFCSASKTTIRYKNMPADTLADNCQFYTTYQNRSN